MQPKTQYLAMLLFILAVLVANTISRSEAQAAPPSGDVIAMSEASGSLFVHILKRAPAGGLSFCTYLRSEGTDRLSFRGCQNVPG